VQQLVPAQHVSAACTGTARISSLYRHSKYQQLVPAQQESAACTGTARISSLYRHSTYQQLVPAQHVSAACTGRASISSLYRHSTYQQLVPAQQVSATCTGTARILNQPRWHKKAVCSTAARILISTLSTGEVSALRPDRFTSGEAMCAPVPEKR